jgi:hypothetical protein
MRPTAAHLIHLGLNSLSRRPVLTAVMVYSIGVGVAVLMAVIAAWRAPSRCPPTRSSAGLYVVHIPAGIPTRNERLDLLINEENVYVSANGRPGQLAAVT